MANPGTISAETSLPAQGTRASSLAPWGAAAGVFLLALALYWPNKLDHDISYFLAVDAMLRDGRALYSDIIDFNTPAAFALARAAHWIAAATGLPIDLAAKALAFALTAAGAALAFMVVRDRLAGPARWIVALGVPAALLFATPDIGGREQLFCAGVLPWALAIATNAPRSRWLSAAIGLAAGCALFLKPHFVLFAVALGIIDLVRAQGRPQRLMLATWIAAAASIGLYAWFLIAEPAWLHDMLPLMLATYGQMKSGAGEMAMMASGQILAILAAAGAGFLLLRSGALPWRPAAVAAAFAGVALLLYVQQGYGFAYQFLPLKTGLALAMVFAVAANITNRSAAAPCAIVFGLAMLWPPAPFQPQPQRGQVTAHPLYQALKPTHDGDAILVISTGVDPTSEMLTFMDAKWAGPIVPFIPVPALIEQGGRTGIANPAPPAERRRWSQWFRQRMLASFTATPPTRVAVEITPQPLFFDAPGFDMLAWLREDPAFDAAWIASGLAPSGQPIRWHDRTYQVWTAN